MPIGSIRAPEAPPQHVRHRLAPKIPLLMTRYRVKFGSSTSNGMNVK